MRFITSFIPLIFILLTSCAQPAVGTTTIPFDLIDNRPFVLVYINGKPLHFIFDTGAGNVIDKDVATNLKLSLKGAGNEYGVGDSAAVLWTTSADSIRFQNVQFDDRSLRVLSLKNIKEKLNLPYLDGIIGYDFMKDYIVQFDFPARVIRLMSACVEKNPIPLDFYYGRTPQVKITVDGFPANVIVDTGDRSYFTLFRHFANANNITTNADTVITGYGIGGPVMAQNIILDKITCGNVNFNNIPSRIPVSNGGGFTDTNIDGSIGTAMLKNYVITIDYKKKVMYLR